MSDLGPTSDLSGTAGEEASKAASENMQQKSTEAARGRKRAPKGTDAQAEDSKPADEPTAPQSPPPEPMKVYLSALVYKNPKSRKSFSVHLLQEKLNELGYEIAYSDRDGDYGDLTAAGVEAFQRDKQLQPTGRVDEQTLRAIFENDERVDVVAY